MSIDYELLCSNDKSYWTKTKRFSLIVFHNLKVVVYSFRVVMLKFQVVKHQTQIVMNSLWVVMLVFYERNGQTLFITT